uniref:Uncharacterized protein n=1 Tax=Callorhinchus milii TaxID=7868 RepID=A0A4W3HG01_CALMI
MVYLPRSDNVPSLTTRATTSGSSNIYRYLGPSFSSCPSLNQRIRGSGKALTLQSSLAALPSIRTTSFNSFRILGGPFSLISLRDLGRTRQPIAHSNVPQTIVD